MALIDQHQTVTENNGSRSGLCTKVEIYNTQKTIKRTVKHKGMIPKLVE